MRKSTKYVLSAAAVLLLIAIGTVLPGELAMGRDRLILGQIHSEPLDATELSDFVNISMADKASLLGQTTGTSLVPLKTGAVYGPDTVRAKFLEELEKLHELRFYPRPVSADLQSFRPAATLYIQNDAPAINMIVWEIAMQMDALNGVFYMDDQTGKILSFQFSGTGFYDLAYTDELAGGWASYLGADVRNIRRSGRADPLDVGGAVAAYLFELYSINRSVSGRISSELGAGAGRESRWSLQYLQILDDRIQSVP